jgi:hypothetical protein
MSEQAIRFGISDGNKYRAATWKLWTPARKSDVYLACRSFGDALKASFHQSGDWHIADSKAFFEENSISELPRRQDRFIEKWHRPESIIPGATLAFRIITPYSAVTIPLGREGKNIIWLPNCPESQATEIVIIITTPGVFLSGLSGKNITDTKLVGSYILENGEAVWVVYRIGNIPNLTFTGSPNAGFFKGHNKEDLSTGNLRAILVCQEPDGSRVMLDCVVQKKSKDGTSI